MKIVFSSNRRFQIWTYCVSHSQLWLRSNKSSEVETRVDLLFKNVFEINMPSRFSGIVISKEEGGLYPNTDPEKFFLMGESWNGHIIADSFFNAEDTAEHSDESSLGNYFYPW